MLLRSLEIKNYRSLESVKLDNLTHFNVLIGRNNSGKSSIFGALALLNSSLRGQYGEWDTVLTGMEASRSLELTLVFSIRPQEREEFFKMVWPDQQEENLREQARNSPLFRQIEYLFRSPPGKPNLLHLRQTRVMAGTGQWVPIQFMHGDEQTSNPQSHLKRMAPGPLKESPLSAESLDVTNKNDVSASHMEAAWLNNNQYRNNAAIENDVMRWPFVQLDNYLGNSFFFTPFRHRLRDCSCAR